MRGSYETLNRISALQAEAAWNRNETIKFAGVPVLVS
jgi:hypothetical protein